VQGAVTEVLAGKCHINISILGQIPNESIETIDATQAAAEQAFPTSIFRSLLK